MGVAFYILLIFGILGILGGIVIASKHGEEREGKYNAGVGVIEMLIGIMFLLMAYGIIE